jgi:peroxiredoxin Q/BCP
MARLLKKGDKAPGFCLFDKNNKKICLTDYKGKWLILYFYPKDNTSGCTKEAQDFSDQVNTFKKYDAHIIGISPDSQASHERFSDKYHLKIILLSDPEHGILEKYGVWQKKKMYGREYFGVVRTTYIINPQGRIEYAWYKVKVKGHVSVVKDKVGETCPLKKK